MISDINTYNVSARVSMVCAAVFASCGVEFQCVRDGVLSVCVEVY